MINLEDKRISEDDYEKLSTFLRFAPYITKNKTPQSFLVKIAKSLIKMDSHTNQIKENTVRSYDNSSKFKTFKGYDYKNMFSDLSVVFIIDILGVKPKHFRTFILWSYLIIGETDFKIIDLKVLNLIFYNYGIIDNKVMNTYYNEINKHWDIIINEN